MVQYVRDDSRFNIGQFLPIIISAIVAVVVTLLCLGLLKACTLINRFIAWYDSKHPPLIQMEEHDWRLREELRKKGLLHRPEEPQVQVNNFLVGNSTQNTHSGTLNGSPDNRMRRVLSRRGVSN